MEDRSTAAGPEFQGRSATGGKAAPMTACILAYLACAIFLASVNATPLLAGPFEDARAAQVRGDHGTAARIYRSLADQGNVAALTQLGILYRAGRGVPRDYGEALTLLRRAASLGSASAQYQVGDMYLRGLGVEQNLLEAARWYTRAAEQGHATAQYSLGIMYKLGGGVRKSQMRAAKWMERSAAQGVPEAQYELGQFYSSGSGSPRNFVAAYKWLALARAAATDSRTRVRAAEALGNVERRMSTAQIATARDNVREWRPVSEMGETP